MNNRVWKGIGYVILGLTILMIVTSFVFANAQTEVEKEEIRFKTSSDLYYKLNEATKIALETAKKDCEVLVAIKKRDGEEVKGEDCGLGF